MTQLLLAMILAIGGIATTIYILLLIEGVKERRQEHRQCGIVLTSDKTGFGR